MYTARTKLRFKQFRINLRQKIYLVFVNVTKQQRTQDDNSMVCDMEA